MTNDDEFDGWDFEGAKTAPELLDQAIEFMDALMGADLSYTVPITDPSLTIRDLVEPDTWDALIAEFKRRRDEL